MAPTFNVAVLIYEGADILDYSGPLEILSISPPSGTETLFKTTTFATQNPVKVAAQALTIIPDASLKEVEANLEQYDIIVVPGAFPSQIVAFLETEGGAAVASLIKRFSELPPRAETGHRIVQSVCTGSLIFAASGILTGRTVTTHHMFYDLLKEMADKALGEDSKINVVREKRWVDAGVTDAGVRIINAGGVTSGIDATLYVLELLAGKEHAEWAAKIVEFERRGQHDGWKA